MVEIEYSTQQGDKMLKDTGALYIPLQDDAAE